MPSFIPPLSFSPSSPPPPPSSTAFTTTTLSNLHFPTLPPLSYHLYILPLFPTTSTHSLTPPTLQHQIATHPAPSPQIEEGGEGDGGQWWKGSSGVGVGGWETVG
ncbi:hypothetical protein LIER_41901 [Lithospermum erythrorhizon]|uniref:Uncharacterized protein n=1 Tax=Lithospermum erythrorhizon TaxID=34254 RepID=A0AAV3RGF7_LITER